MKWCIMIWISSMLQPPPFTKAMKILAFKPGAHHPNHSSHLFQPDCRRKGKLAYAGVRSQHTKKVKYKNKSATTEFWCYASSLWVWGCIIVFFFWLYYDSVDTIISVLFSFDFFWCNMQLCLMLQEKISPWKLFLLWLKGLTLMKWSMCWEWDMRAF